MVVLIETEDVLLAGTGSTTRGCGHGGFVDQGPAGVRGQGGGYGVGDDATVLKGSGGVEITAAGGPLRRRW